MRTRIENAMPIKVNISLSAGGRLKPVASHTLDQTRITIGRDKECALTLEDTQKHISRVHAELEEEDGCYWMKVISKVNPVIVNGRRYTYGNRVALADGDQVNIGLYKLEIVVPEVPIEPAAEPAVEPVAPAQPVTPVVADPFEELTYVRRPVAKQTLPQSRAAPAYTAEDSLSEEETQVRPSTPEAAPRAAPSAAQPAGAADVGADRAVQAFLEGAGLSHLEISDPEAFMRDSGVMVRAAVEGIMMLLLARAEARKELGAEPPAAGADDNPLKSMASPAEVIAFLFDPKRRTSGDADPVQAFGDACGDLRAHQVALFAGMRAAVLSALRSIDPKRIEREHGRNLGGLNLTRKSKLWDLSIAQHEKLAREMEEDFSNVFGREILAAYSAQVRKVRGGR